MSFDPPDQFGEHVCKRRRGCDQFVHLAVRSHELVGAGRLVLGESQPDLGRNRGGRVLEHSEVCVAPFTPGPITDTDRTDDLVLDNDWRLSTGVLVIDLRRQIRMGDCAAAALHVYAIGVEQRDRCGLSAGRATQRGAPTIEVRVGRRVEQTGAVEQRQAADLRGVGACHRRGCVCLPHHLDSRPKAAKLDYRG